MKKGNNPTRAEWLNLGKAALLAGALFAIPPVSDLYLEKQAERRAYLDSIGVSNYGEVDSSELDLEPITEDSDYIKNQRELFEKAWESDPGHYHLDYDDEETKTPEPSQPKSNNYSNNVIQDMAGILYCEAANQSPKARKLIARMVKNRESRRDYPNKMEEILTNKTFSCIEDPNNTNWAKIKGKAPMNYTDKKALEDCARDAKSILVSGYRLGVPREEEIVAYHDSSIKQPSTKYWRSLEPVHTEGKLVFYAPKSK